MTYHSIRKNKLYPKIHMPNKENKQCNQQISANICISITFWIKSHLLKTLVIQQIWHLHDVLTNYDSTIWKKKKAQLLCYTLHQHVWHSALLHLQFWCYHSLVFASIGAWNKRGVLKFSCKVQLKREVKGVWLITSAPFGKDHLIHK